MLPGKGGGESTTTRKAGGFEFRSMAGNPKSTQRFDCCTGKRVQRARFENNQSWIGRPLNFLIDQIMTRAYPVFKGVQISFPYPAKIAQPRLEEETMKEIDALNFPGDVRYSRDHEWARKDGDIFTVGISDFAQDQLGDVVYVELPETGSSLEKGREFGTVESVKAVSELFMPVAGEVVAINTGLEDSPERVNNDPYGEGWMIKVRSASPGDFDGLMDREAYLAHVKG